MGALGGFFGKSDAEKKAEEEQKLKVRISKAPQLSPEAKHWISEVTAKVRSMGAPKQPHSSMLFHEKTESNSTSLTPQAIMESGTDASFLVVKTIPHPKMKGKFAYVVQFGKNTNALLSKKVATATQRLMFENPEDFQEIMLDGRSRLLIHEWKIKLPIENGQLGGMFPKTQGETLFGHAKMLLILFGIVCLFSLCCCRGAFHYYFCCCLCKSKPGQKKKGQDPLVLKKDDQEVTYPAAVQERKHKSIKLAESPVRTRRDTILDVSAMQTKESTPLEPIQAMEIPEIPEIPAEPTLSGSGDEATLEV